MKREINQKNVTVYYAVIQALYFMIGAMVFCYASAYLLHRGFTNGQIGMTLGVANLLSAFLQPAIAVFVQKTGIRLGTCVAALYGVFGLLILVLLALPMEGIFLVAVMVLIFLVQSALQPSINSLYRGYDNKGIKVNFGLARGVGSLAFSMGSLLTGQLLRYFTPDVLPMMYLIPAILMIIAVLLFHAPNVGPEEGMPVTPKQKALLLKEYPHFYMFLAGVVCLAVTHCFTETYLLQIIRRIGGTSANLGIAIAISAITELPAMMLYRKVSKKVGNRRLLMFAGWMWAAKNILIMFAPNIYVVYAAELLQFISYAIYVPAGIRYVSHAIPESQFLKGQALTGSAFTVGGLLATFLGGQMLDFFGLRVSCLIIQIFSITGIVLFTIAMLDSIRRFPTVESPID